MFIGVNSISIAGAITALVIAGGCVLISLFNVKVRMKFVFMTVYCLIISFIVYSMLITDPLLLKQVAVNYSVGLSILSLLTLYYSEYFSISNKNLKKLREDATKDFLTGLNNVRSFNNILNSLMQEVLEKNEQLSILSLNIDFFKKVNDTYGHSAGDLVLKEIGEILSTA